MTLRRLSRPLACLVLAAGSPAPAQGPAVEPPPGFVALFNGKDTTGWVGMPHKDPRDLAEMPEAVRARQLASWTEDALRHWSVQGGELVNDGEGPYLTSAGSYGDIQLSIEYKTVPKADSGIYLRANPQVQIWDFTKGGEKQNLGADKGSGGLWNNSPGAPGKDPLVLADKPFGEWNKLEITQLGARTSVVLNGKLVVDNAPMENYFDRRAPLFAKGPIQLQTHGGEIRWRNLFLREIPPAEANKMLASRQMRGFEPLSEKGLEGWAGPVDNYEVVDGAIRCKAGNGGTVYFNKRYADFVAKLEFRLPPGGNNGLAIRYPGQGDTAYAGMCELQVLDDTSPKYTKLDPRQYHGSAYGIAPAHQGYLRPVGQWNYQEVTVQGSRIKVELNGTVILDADLAPIQEYMADGAHPGKIRTSGYFGFAGHGDAVEFRDVAIKALP